MHTYPFSKFRNKFDLDLFLFVWADSHESKLHDECIQKIIKDLKNRKCQL